MRVFLKILQNNKLFDLKKKVVTIKEAKEFRKRALSEEEIIESVFNMEI